MPEDETENFTVTTSDAPVAIEAEIKEPEVKEPEKKEAEPQPNEEEQPRQKSRAQKRIESLATEKRELQRELDELRKQLNGNNAPKATELDPGDFDDYDDYLEAVEKQQAPKAKGEEDPAAAYVDPLADFRDEMESKFDDGRDAHEDFDEKIKAMPILTVEMLEAITESDDAGEVAYYLAHNPDEAEKLAKLSFGKMAIEIGKIETKLRNPSKGEAKQPPKQKQTQAPDPITPVGGNGDYQKSLDDMDFAEFEKSRNTEAASKKFW